MPEAATKKPSSVRPAWDRDRGSGHRASLGPADHEISTSGVRFSIVSACVRGTGRDHSQCSAPETVMELAVDKDDSAVGISRCFQRNPFK